MPLSLGFGEWGCPHHCDTGTKCSFSLRGGPKKRREWGEEEEEKRPFPFPFPFPYPFGHLLRSLVFTCSGNSIWRGLSDWPNLFAITVSFYRSSLSYIFILLLGQRKLFLIPRTWLYRGSLQYRGSTVWRCLAGTNCRSQIYRCVR